MINLEIFDSFMLELGIGGKEREAIIKHIDQKRTVKGIELIDFLEWAMDNYNGNLHDMVVAEWMKYHHSDYVISMEDDLYIYSLTEWLDKRCYFTEHQKDYVYFGIKMAILDERKK